MKVTLVALAAAVAFAPLAALADDSSPASTASALDTLSSSTARLDIVDPQTNRVIAEFITIDGQSHVVRYQPSMSALRAAASGYVKPFGVVTIGQENEASARAFAEAYHTNPSP